MPVTLGYWGIKGLAEYSRLTLLLAGVEFNEYNPESPQAWGEKKATLASSFPNLPYIDVDGHVLTESGAIPWFVAKKFKPCLAGSTPEEEAEILQIIGVLGDLRTEVFKFLFSPEYKEGLAKAATEGKIPAKLAALAKHVEGKHFAVGGHATIADIFIAYTLYITSTVYTSAELECPVAAHGLSSFVAGVWALPELTAHVHGPNWSKPIMPPTMVSWLKY
jgi:glutathione S-transferase